MSSPSSAGGDPRFVCSLRFAEPTTTLKHRILASTTAARLFPPVNPPSGSGLWSSGRRGRRCATALSQSARQSSSPATTQRSSGPAIRWMIRRLQRLGPVSLSSGSPSWGTSGPSCEPKYRGAIQASSRRPRPVEMATATAPPSPTLLRQPQRQRHRPGAAPATRGKPPRRQLHN